MSCQRVNYVPSKCHRDLAGRTPSYKTPRARVYMYPDIPVAAVARPPHVMNIFTLIGRLGIFHLALVVVSDESPKCVHPFDTLFISTGRVCLFEGRHSPCSFHRELAYER